MTYYSSLKSRLFLSLIIGLVVCHAATSLKAQTYVTADPGGTGTQTIVIPGGTGTVINDVNVSFDYFDTGGSFTSEVTTTLTSPLGTVVNLWGPGYGTTGLTGGIYVFNDEAAGAMPVSAVPGTWRVAGTNMSRLSDFDGEVVDGTWTLTGTDFSGNQSFDAFTLGINNIEPATPTAAAPVFYREPEPEPFIAIDFGAIMSTMTSGLGMGLVNQQVTQGAPNAALRDLNNRLFRSRSGMEQIFADGFESGDTTDWTGASANSGSSLLRHLAFVQDENMSYKVALGLADPEERTVEVNVADTLSAQTGSNFNGQSLGGGLPYAMMGVPMMPMAGGAATVQIVEAAPSGKTVIDDSKAVVEMAPRNQWEVFVAGDFSFYDQDQLTDLMQGFDTDTYAGTVGLEYRIKEWLNLGLGWSYLQSDTNVSGNYGDIDLEGNMITGYATAFWRQYWADILYSYGSFNNDINRNTGLGSRARGDTDSQSHNIRLNFGRNFNVGNNITTGPIAGLQYANGDIDPYSENGGGTAALDYSGTSFESMVSRLGWQATHFRSTNWGRLVSQVHLAWEHEYMPENGTVGASLQTSPFALVTGSNVSRFGGYSTESDGAHPGTDWLSAGAGLRFELANGVAFLTDYEGVFFRSNSSQHYASAKLSYEWGAFMPSQKSEDCCGKEIVAYEPLPVEQSDQQIAAATETTREVAEKKQSPATFADWLKKGDRNSGSVASAGSKPEAMKKSTVAAYEPLTVEQPGSHAAAPSEADADLPQVTKKKKSTGGVIGWLRNRKSKSGASDEQPTAELKSENIVEEVAEPVAVSSGGRGHQKGAVVYKTWGDVPGLKKTETTAAPEKAVEPENPSS